MFHQGPKLNSAFLHLVAREEEGDWIQDLSVQERAMRYLSAGLTVARVLQSSTKREKSSTMEFSQHSILLVVNISESKENKL